MLVNCIKVYSMVMPINHCIPIQLITAIHEYETQIEKRRVLEKHL